MALWHCGIALGLGAPHSAAGFKGPTSKGREGAEGKGRGDGRAGIGEGRGGEAGRCHGPRTGKRRAHGAHAISLASCIYSISIGQWYRLAVNNRTISTVTSLSQFIIFL